MAKIHLLDNETINKIAAGEVIENPKSIVKELVENSIDAGADEITVEIRKGGKDLIRITDNGKGIERDEVEDAFKRHCTSKIETSDDLNSLHTLGFRGEALASIAAVSHVEVISRTNDDSCGVKLIIDGGNIAFREDIGCPVGTTISVTELFYNVPARKKFLKSDLAESGSINESVISLALCSENTSFKYINNGTVAFKTPKSKSLLNVISSLYDRDLCEALLPVDYESTTLKIKGYTTNLNYYRGNRKNQLVFVNGRVIKHKRINYFIEAAYNTLLPKNKYPACFLKLEIEPSLVDVNVHPAKTEVRFQNEEHVLNEVKKAIYRSLNSVSIIKEIKKETIIPDISGIQNKGNVENKNIFDNYSFESFKNINNIRFTEVKSNDEIKSGSIFEDIIDRSSDKEPSAAEDIKFPGLENGTMLAREKEHSYVQGSFLEAEKAAESPEKSSYEKIPELSLIGILMDTYIICESRDKSEMYMIDQHAAHERINYERFLNQYNNRQIVRQELLAPEVISLSYEDYYSAVSSKEIFEGLGISIENFGINAILINEIPAIFSGSNIKDLFFTILDSLKSTNRTNINLEIGKIIKNACVKSVKSGDKLHAAEINKLIEDLKNTENPYTCPHGRPVIIKLTKYEIERMFERIQN